MRMLMRLVHAEAEPEVVRWAGNVAQLAVMVTVVVAVVRALV